MRKVSCKTVLFFIILLFASFYNSNSFKSKQQSIQQSHQLSQPLSQPNQHSQSSEANEKIIEFSDSSNDDEVGGTLLSILKPLTEDKSMFLKTIPKKDKDFNPFIATDKSNNDDKANSNTKTNNSLKPKLEPQQRVTMSNTIQPIIPEKTSTTSTTATSPNINETPDYSKMHKPYGDKSTQVKKKIEVVSLLILGLCLLLIKLVLPFMDIGKDKFFSKSVTLLSTQMMLLCIIVSFLQILYTCGVLDNLQFNWQILITSLNLFGILWFILGVVLSFLSYLVILKWDYLEDNAKSFGKNY